MDSDVGRRIRELREAHCYSREWFAELADISPKFLYDLEAGNKGCSAEVIYRISKVLSVSVEYLMTGEDAESQGTEKLIGILEMIGPKKKSQITELLDLMSRMCDLL